MEDKLFSDVLDLLVDGPSHVAGLYASLVKHVRAVPIDDVTEVIRELDEQSFVRLWFDHSGESKAATTRERDYALVRYEAELVRVDLDSLYHDEIGLWCEITSSGRKRWEAAGNDVELDGVHWTLDEELEARSLTIRAETKSAAERVLHWWLDRHPESEPVTGVVMKPVSNFRLRDGSVIVGGVELTCTVGS